VVTQDEFFLEHIETIRKSNEGGKEIAYLNCSKCSFNRSAPHRAELYTIGRNVWAREHFEFINGKTEILEEPIEIQNIEEELLATRKNEQDYWLKLDNLTENIPDDDADIRTIIDYFASVVRDKSVQHIDSEIVQKKYNDWVTYYNKHGKVDENLSFSEIRYWQFRITRLMHFDSISINEDWKTSQPFFIDLLRRARELKLK
jgi:hypothetical protein